MYVKHHFFSDPGPKNDQRLAGNLSENKATSVSSAMHSCSYFMSLWVAHFGHELLDSVDELQCGESWEIFHSNSIGSPPILSKIQSSDELLNHVSHPMQYLIVGSRSSFQGTIQNLRIRRPFVQETDDLFITNQRQMLP